MQFRGRSQRVGDSAPGSSCPHMRERRRREGTFSPSLDSMSVRRERQDILNNLDPPGSGELDDDDLMLDVDLPEDGLHETDRMSHIERSDRAGRQGQRRKHHRWSGPDHFHNDNRSHVFQHYDGLKASRISPRQIPSEGRQHGYMAMLDELTLEHMTQDCSSLKNQLLRLKTLLQIEDTDSSADAPEEIEDNTTASQPAQGRPFRCQCHHQRAPSSLRPSDRQMDKRMQHQYDKATQTYWRPSSHAGVLPAPLLSPWQAQHQGLTRTSMPQRRQTLDSDLPGPNRSMRAVPNMLNLALAVMKLNGEKSERLPARGSKENSSHSSRPGGGGEVEECERVHTSLNKEI
ncbi:Serine-rich coiled-coil domain-containing protein 2 [Nibea albiflora]|uniref:Serine-rich coiled-coil domain-containing protein 2 n=1 Tax=Nibea albiflora TaxID=240163 RepID=A0ACB7EF30_NIBAL|nr:Serine-rich coiled-coil domain-containing protein 2 [Nibea albiflora]